MFNLLSSNIAQIHCDQLLEKYAVIFICLRVNHIRHDSDYFDNGIRAVRAKYGSISLFTPVEISEVAVTRNW